MPYFNGKCLILRAISVFVYTYRMEDKHRHNLYPFRFGSEFHLRRFLQKVLNLDDIKILITIHYPCQMEVIMQGIYIPGRSYIKDPLPE